MISSPNCLPRLSPVRRLRVYMRLALCLAVPAFAQNSAPPVLAHLHGWGRSCAGELILTQHTISWVTPWSPCRASAFRVLEQHDSRRGDLDRLYHLQHVSKGCAYPYIELTYGKGAPGLAWSARGFSSRQAATRRQMVGSLGCQLEQVSFERQSATEVRK